MPAGSLAVRTDTLESTYRFYRGTMSTNVPDKPSRNIGEKETHGKTKTPWNPWNSIHHKTRERHEVLIHTSPFHAEELRQRPSNLAVQLRPHLPR